jgi:hypothetical protein
MVSADARSSYVRPLDALLIHGLLALGARRRPVIRILFDPRSGYRRSDAFEAGAAENELAAPQCAGLLPAGSQLSLTSSYNPTVPAIFTEDTTG